MLLKVFEFKLNQFINQFKLKVLQKLAYRNFEFLVNRFSNWFITFWKEGWIMNRFKMKAWGYWIDSVIDSFMIQHDWLVDVLIWINSSMKIRHLNRFKNRSLVIFTVLDPHLYIASCLICKHIQHAKLRETQKLFTDFYKKLSTFDSKGNLHWSTHD